MLLKYQYPSLEEVPEDYRALYSERGGKAVLSSVSGLPDPGEVDRLNGALEKERNDHKQTKDRLRPWADMDYDETIAKLDRFDELEAAAGDSLDDDKIDEMVQKRVQARLNSTTAPLERKVKKLEGDLEEVTQERDSLVTEKRTATIHSELRKVLTEAKVLPDAVDDVISAYAGSFEIREDDGKVVTKDGVGLPPGITPDIWLGDIKDSKSYWFAGNVGGGGKGGKGGGVGDNPWSRKHWNVTRQMQISAANPDKAASMAEMAGSKVGATRPPAEG